MPINRQLNSREYKIIINHEKFSNEEAGIEIIAGKINSQIKILKGKFEENVKKKKPKKVWYLDTEKHELYRTNNFIIVVKEDPTSDGIEYDVTFKNRNPNRETAVQYDLFNPVLNPIFEFKRDKSKFEEDIVTPFVSKFSVSAKLEYKQIPNLNTYQDILSIYPDLNFVSKTKGSPLGINGAILTVNGFVAGEVSYDLGKLTFGNGKEAKVQLSLWRLLDEKGKPIYNDENPVIAEFDIDVDADNSTISEGGQPEEFPESRVGDINKFYNALQTEDIVDKDSPTTKTEYVYNYKKQQ